MRVEDIKVGKTYVGSKGRPRTVVSMGTSLSGRRDSGNIIYQAFGEKQLRQCWHYTFAGWAIGDPDAIAEATKAKALHDAAPDLYLALEQAEQFLLDADYRENGFEIKVVRAALEKARGEA